VLSPALTDSHPALIPLHSEHHQGTCDKDILPFDGNDLNHINPHHKLVINLSQKLFSLTINDKCNYKNSTLTKPASKWQKDSVKRK
jgi:hypothetical protein